MQKSAENLKYGLHTKMSPKGAYGKVNSVDPDYVACLGLTWLSTIFQSYHDGVWLRQGVQCSLL